MTQRRSRSRTRKPLLPHTCDRPEPELPSLPHSGRDRLAPGALDLVKGEAEQSVDLELAVINNLADTRSRHAVIMAQRLELCLLYTSDAADDCCRV